jgi:hypothetical protein
VGGMFAGNEQHSTEVKIGCGEVKVKPPKLIELLGLESSTKRTLSCTNGGLKRMVQEV